MLCFYHKAHFDVVAYTLMAYFVLSPNCEEFYSSPCITQSSQSEQYCFSDAPGQIYIQTHIPTCITITQLSVTNKVFSLASTRRVVVERIRIFGKQDNDARSA